MAEATIPVDLRNPGQVFACLGLMEAAEILCGPCEGGFNYRGRETSANFTLATAAADNPVERVVAFLAKAEVTVEAPLRSRLSTAKWGVETIRRGDPVFPSPVPESPATLPVYLTADKKSIAIEHWLDGDHNGRDNVKFWAGASGYPGAALARDALSQVKALGDNALAVAAADPFAVSGPQSSSFRFDWRRDYIPMEVGFSPNKHSAMTMVGYPLVEILAAIGMQHARPQRPEQRNKLLYRYGVTNTRLPIVFARAVLGAQSVGFPMRVFRMRLGWPGQEGQARCIVDAEEENIQ
jgi:CRISPR-associated protein Csx14